MKGADTYEPIEITLTREDREAVERYARKHRVSVEDAFKNALFERIEQEQKALQVDIAKDLQNTQAGQSRLFEDEIEEIHQS